MRSHRATSGAFDVGRRRAACCRLGGHTPAHSWYEDPTGRVFAPFGLCSTPTEKWRGGWGMLPRGLATSTEGAGTIEAGVPD